MTKYAARRLTDVTAGAGTAHPNTLHPPGAAVIRVSVSPAGEAGCRGKSRHRKRR
jgi:hypothetical protein